MDMIERVARAIAAANGDPEAFAYHDDYKTFARAAVEAMREPTQAMLDEVCSDDAYALISANDDTMRAVWGEMIDAALRECAHNQPTDL